MPLDKFGRQSASNGVGLRGPKGEGFALTSEGDYDMQMKRVRNLSNPSQSSDAVTLDSMSKINANNLKLVNNKYDANKKVITNVGGPPTNDSDVINFRYFKARSLVYNPQTNEFNAKGGRIINVAKPEQAHDAVSYKYFIATLSLLSYSIYKQIHKDKKTLRSSDDWTNTILTKDFKWDDLFTVVDVKQIIRQSRPTQTGEVKPQS